MAEIEYVFKAAWNKEWYLAVQSEGKAAADRTRAEWQSCWSMNFSNSIIVSRYLFLKL